MRLWVEQARQNLWRELIWPCRRTWVGLAVVWLLLLVFNLSQPGRGPVAVAKAATPFSQRRIAFQEQRRLLEEILGPAPRSTPAEPPRRPNLQPRSERRSVGLA